MKNKQVQHANKAISDAMHFIKELKASPNSATAAPAIPRVTQPTQRLQGTHRGNCTTKTTTTQFSNIPISLLQYSNGVIIQGQGYPSRAGEPFISLFATYWTKVMGNGATAKFTLHRSDGNNAIWLVVGGVGRTNQLLNLVTGATLTIMGSQAVLDGAISHPYKATIHATMLFLF